MSCCIVRIPYALQTFVEYFKNECVSGIGGLCMSHPSIEFIVNIISKVFAFVYGIPKAVKAFTI